MQVIIGLRRKTPLFKEGFLKSLMSLWNILAAELAAWCSSTSTTLDFKTIERRVEHEGLSFLTITLPAFGKDFQKSLDQGFVSRDLFQGFSWQAGLPRFLGGFLETVFSRCDGQLLTDPCVDSIYAIQQLTFLFGKMELPCSDERVRSAMHGFIECEHDVRDSHNKITPIQWADFVRVSGLLFRDLFTDLDNRVNTGSIVPKHGPGATAERRSSNQKYVPHMWTERLNSIFPVMDHAVASYSLYDYVEETTDIVDPGSEIPVRVISVPKTLKTPRIIAIEPTPMQYMQQGVLESIVTSLTEKRANPQQEWFRKHLYQMIGFDDQTPNQRLAHRGSLDGSLATLDLSEASDRVSNQHVRHLLLRHPLSSEAVDACRSRKADVPGFGEIRLAKFASMGSALCFPMEAMVFLTVVFIAIEKELNCHLNRKLISELSDSVRVYGDDIIVPAHFASPVVRCLESFGFKVNDRKSFWTGRFRESCGKEYYDGTDVSPVKFRRNFPKRLGHAQEVQSLVAFRNLVYSRGLWQTAFYLDHEIERILPFYPKVGQNASCLGAHTFLPIEGEKWDPHLHIFKVKGYAVKAQLPVDEIDGWSSLLKFFLKRGEMPLSEDSFRRAGRPRAVRLKPRWVDPN